MLFQEGRKEPGPGTTEGVLADRVENLRPGQYRPLERAADFGSPDPHAIPHRDLNDPQARLQSLDLHLDRPAVIAIPHSQPFERLAPDRAERAEVGVAKSETPTYQRRRQPIAPTLLRR